MTSSENINTSIDSTMDHTVDKRRRLSAGKWRKMRLICQTVAFGLAALLAMPASADLQAMLAKMNSYSATFTQTIMGGHNQILQQSDGRVRIATPSRFKWVVNDPYPQTLVTVGEKLYLYDPDLEQLTVEPLAAAIAGTPALLLTGGVQDLQSMFEISEIFDGEDTAYSLYPKSEDALFAQIRLRFDGKSRLSHLEIEDHLGQLTRVAFADVAQNAKIAANEFAFKVPEGTEVIGEL